MRFRQFRLRYSAVLQLPRPLGDPWGLPFIPTLARPEWRPPAELCETAEEWIVKVELGGMQEEDFEILLYDNRLIVRGERAWSPDRSGQARFHIAEIHHGPFQVEMPLPAPVDRERVSAQYERGFLCVNLPKAGMPR